MPVNEVWIIGDWQQEHFSQPVGWLRDHANCEFFANSESAIGSRRDDVLCARPGAILVVQSRPGQIAAADVEQLHALAPLARLVGLVGPWCEGELRSGRPWPGVNRVPWRDWQWRLARELGVDSGLLSRSHHLARTATDTDRLHQSFPGIAHLGRFSGCAEVLTTSRVNYDSWRVALRLLEVASHCPIFDGTAQATGDFQLIDGWENMPSGASAGDRLRRILALHFPRPQDLHRALLLGITRVIALPLLLADLAAALRSVLPSAADATRESAA